MATYSIAEIENNIVSESKALDFLKELLRPETVIEFDPQDIPQIIAHLNWATIDFNIEEVPANASITPTVMSAYQDIQTSFYQVAAIIEHGIANTNKLSLEDKKNLELYVIIKEGSSKQATPLDSILANVVAKAVGKMNGKQTLILLITCACLWAGYESFKIHLESERAIKLAEITSQEKKATLEAMNFQSQVVAEHGETIAKAISSLPNGAEIETRAKMANASLVKAASETKGGAEIRGQNLSEHEAKILVRNKRRSVTEIQMTKEVRIIGLHIDGAMTVRYEDPDDLTVYDIKCTDAQRIENFKKPLADSMLSGEVINIRILAKDKEGDIFPEEFISVATETLTAVE